MQVYNLFIIMIGRLYDKPYEQTYHKRARKRLLCWDLLWEKSKVGSGHGTMACGANVAFLFKEMIFDK